MTVRIESVVAQSLDELIALRHDIHAHPELGMTEVRTARCVAEVLRRYGCDEVVEGVGKTGVVALIRGNIPSDRCIGFRADMDALPLEEKSGVAWTSQTPGCQHACGHDGHTATAVAIARALAADREFPGTAMIIIQPGEEGYAGAREMINDGLFTRWHVDEVYGQHGGVELPLGQYASPEGTMTAAADLFIIEVKGLGGHGARPHNCVDPVVAASQLVVALQTIVSRSTDPMQSAVVSVGSIHAGSEKGVSVIPNNVRLAGTTRCMSPENRDMIERRMKEICDGVGAMTGCEITLDYQRKYPPLVNHSAQRRALLDFFKVEAGDAAVVEQFPSSMGAEDFAFMLEEVPGCYVRTGLRDETHTQSVHHPGFDYNDLAIAPTASLFARFIRARLTALDRGEA